MKNIKQMTIKSESIKEFDNVCNDMREHFEVIAEQTTALFDKETIVHVAVIFYYDKPQ